MLRSHWVSLHQLIAATKNRGRLKQLDERIERMIIQALHKLRNLEVALTESRILAAGGINTGDVCHCLQNFLQQGCCDVS